MNYKESDKKIIENANYRYYDFNEKNIKDIIKKHIQDVTSEEWRTLIQMLYPKNMLASGLFQAILIFKISQNGKRVDPPLEAYNSVDELKDNDCLIFRIMNYIEKYSNFKFHNSWHKVREILRKENKNEKM